LTVILFVPIVIFLTSCRKDIPMPDPEFEKLFGTREWLQSSRGKSGHTTSPSTVGFTLSVEYKSNGGHKKYKNGNVESKMTFKFSLGTSIYSTLQTYLITYKEGGSSKKGVVSDSFKFGGHDTLFLYNECYDCYADVFIKQK
jgi:hypothetical protein